MSRRSRGCLRCRQRRVKCGQERPSCMRCVTRNELCIGYRDESDLIFEHETEKIVQRSLGDGASSTANARTRSRSLSRLVSTPSSQSSPASITSWKTDLTVPDETEDPKITAFMDNYVIYPCTESSGVGFLEHLPCLFKEVNVEGRYALRFAVQAAAYADVSRQQQSEADGKKALEYYGKALAALSQSLAEKGKAPDDYDLMTVVILDIFETLFLPDHLSSGSHSQGMAHILRLRSHDQFHDPRGWSLFRLAHHRLQKQQLAKGLDPLPESKQWLASTTDLLNQTERDSFSMNEICKTAREVLDKVQQDSTADEELLPLIQKMIELDAQAASWRKTPQWDFKTLDRQSILGNDGLAALLPETIQIHRDLWMIYEWNYHRTARIILHQQLLRCTQAALCRLDGQFRPQLQSLQDASTLIAQDLADQVLSTVPQSFGDVDADGNLSIYHELFGSQAIGAYFLLWPIKIIKGQDGASSAKQKDAANAIFERISECTGMKANLGSLSLI